MLERGAEVAGGGRLALRAVYPPHQRRVFYGAKDRFVFASYNDSCPSMIATGCQRYSCIAVACLNYLTFVSSILYNLPRFSPRARTGYMYNQLAVGTSLNVMIRIYPAYQPTYLPFSLSPLRPLAPPCPIPNTVTGPILHSLHPPKLHIHPSIPPHPAAFRRINPYRRREI